MAVQMNGAAWHELCATHCIGAQEKISQLADFCRLGAVVVQFRCKFDSLSGSFGP
jgi:hypothetical protein